MPRFRVRINATLEAEDIDDALLLLALNFLEDLVGQDNLRLLGEVDIHSEKE